MSAVVVTGGTGTFGRAFIRAALRETLTNVHESHPWLLDEGGEPKGGRLPASLMRWSRVVSLSRDEVKAAQMVDDFGHYPAFKAFVGDVRDRDRLAWAFRGADVVVHAAALKRVDQGAYSPSEMLQTNITGTMNVVREAIEAGVKRVVVISSDKACQPTNIYGATKLCGEFYAVNANNYGHNSGTAIAVVRYGNVLGSRGSVAHVWRRQLQAGGPVTLTAPDMTRFIMTIEQAVGLVNHALREMRGGEVFVPVLPSARMRDLLEACVETWPAPGASPLGPEVRLTGLRPGGEKMAEALLSEEEPYRTRRVNGHFVVLPTHHEWVAKHYWDEVGERVPKDLVYRSDLNDRWLSVADLRALLAQTEAMR